MHRCKLVSEHFVDLWMLVVSC